MTNNAAQAPGFGHGVSCARRNERSIASPRCLLFDNCISCWLSQRGGDVKLGPTGSAHLLDGPNMREAIARPLSGQAAQSG